MKKFRDVGNVSVIVTPANPFNRTQHHLSHIITSLNHV